MDHLSARITRMSGLSGYIFREIGWGTYQSPLADITCLHATTLVKTERVDDMPYHSFDRSLAYLYALHLGKKKASKKETKTNAMQALDAILSFRRNGIHYAIKDQGIGANHLSKKNYDIIPILCQLINVGVEDVGFEMEESPAKLPFYGYWGVPIGQCVGCVTLDYNKLEARILKESETIKRYVKKIVDTKSIYKRKTFLSEGQEKALKALGKDHPEIQWMLNKRSLLLLFPPAIQKTLLKPPIPEP